MIYNDLQPIAIMIYIVYN